MSVDLIERTSMNWLEGLHDHMAEPDRQQAMPVFAGQKLVVVGGNSGMRRQTAVIVGQDPGRVDETVQTLPKDGSADGITANLVDREQVERVRRQLADEHADATRWSTPPDRSRPSFSWTTTAPLTTPTSNWTGALTPRRGAAHQTRPANRRRLLRHRVRRDGADVQRR